MTAEEKNVLHACGLFQGIAPEEAEQLLTCLHAEEAVFEKNEIIFHMGQPIQSCILILSGAVRAETVNAAGEHSLMAYHGAGALVGDVLMATPGGVSPVYVIAAERVKLVYLPFRRIMGSCPKCCPAHTRLRENLISEIAQKFWAQRRLTRYLTAKSLRGRIAMYLLDQEGSTFSLGGTREDLADRLCVNRSALSRELGRMKAEGLVDFYRDTFRILDAEKLRQYAAL